MSRPKPTPSRGLLERLIKENTVYRGNSVDFRADEIVLPNGRRAVREYMDHPGAAAVVPFVSPETIVLVRQYRFPVRRATLEIPAGKLAKGEAPVACLRRELREETGYSAGRLTPLIAYWPTPAFANEVLHVYEARDLRAGRRHPDEDEFLEVVAMGFDNALGLVLSGKIRDSKTVIGLLLCALKRSAGGHFTKIG